MGLTTAASEPRESALFAYYVTGAGPLLRTVGRSAISTLMSDESVPIEMDGIGGVIIKAMEQHLRDALRSHGISTVEIRAVRKGGEPTLEFSGPEEDVKKAKDCLGYVKMKDYLRGGHSQ